MTMLAVVHFPLLGQHSVVWGHCGRDIHNRNLRSWLASRFCRKAMLPSVPSAG